MAEPASNGCTGLCCAAFSITTHSRSDLRRLARESGPDSEAAQVLEMLIPLTPKEATERNREFGGSTRFPWKDRGTHFTCRHWDEETRLCTNYEDRPAMCRGFPYKRMDGCPFGCTCKGEPVGKGCSGA